MLSRRLVHSLRRQPGRARTANAMLVHVHGVTEQMAGMIAGEQRVIRGSASAGRSVAIRDRCRRISPHRPYGSRTVDRRVSHRDYFVPSTDLQCRRSARASVPLAADALARHTEKSRGPLERQNSRAKNDGPEPSASRMAIRISSAIRPRTVGDIERTNRRGRRSLPIDALFADLGVLPRCAVSSSPSSRSTARRRAGCRVEFQRVVAVIIADVDDSFVLRERHRFGPKHPAKSS